VNNPRLLLADEPTGALDSKTSADIMGLFCELNRQRVTIVVVTHEPEVPKRARRKIIFHDGAIIEDTRLPALKAMPQ
jgi:putative ABC transport system ATP-binding protein